MLSSSLGELAHKVSIFDIYLCYYPLFIDAGQFLNLHSCENKWMEFITTQSNDVQEYTDEIIGYLRGMQYSLTEDSLSQAAGLFEGSDVWQNSDKLRRWFQGKWLHLAKVMLFLFYLTLNIYMHESLSCGNYHCK